VLDEGVYVVAKGWPDVFEHSCQIYLNIWWLYE
jgi:hypothetical protein